MLARTIALPLLVTLAQASLACPSETFLSIDEELRSADSVVIGRVVAEKYSAEGPGQGWVDGTLYTLHVVEHVNGKHFRSVRLFSENSSGRFRMEVGETYLAFISFCDGQRYIDARGNSGLLSHKRDTLSTVRTIIARRRVRPNLSLNPDAPPAGARSNIFARPPKYGGAPVSLVR